MPMLRITLVAFAAFAAVTCWTKTPEEAAAQPTGTPSSASGTEPPVILMLQNSGLTPPRPDARRDGILFAAWEDGLILLSSAGTPEAPLVCGTSPPASIRALLDDLKRTGFTELERDSYLVTDVPSMDIRIRLGDAHHAHAWHGVLIPGFGGDLNTDTEYRHFVTVWRKARALILAVTPESVAVVDRSKPVRGLNLNDPSATSWMAPGGWRSNAKK